MAVQPRPPVPGACCHRLEARRQQPAATARPAERPRADPRHRLVADHRVRARQDRSSTGAAHIEPASAQSNQSTRRSTTPPQPLATSRANTPDRSATVRAPVRRRSAPPAAFLITISTAPSGSTPAARRQRRSCAGSTTLRANRITPAADAREERRLGRRQLRPAIPTMRLSSDSLAQNAFRTKQARRARVNTLVIPGTTMPRPSA